MSICCSAVASRFWLSAAPSSVFIPESLRVMRCNGGIDGQDHIRVGKMNMVDLAGSERQSKTGATGDTLKEFRFETLHSSFAFGLVESAVPH